MDKAIYPIQYTTDSRLEKKFDNLLKKAKKVTALVSGDNPLKLPPPSWFDEPRFLKAQTLARSHRLSFQFASLIGIVLLAITPSAMVQFVASNNFGNPYKALLRVFSTFKHINIWYDGNPYDKSTKIHSSLNRVRGYHLQLGQLLQRKYPDKTNLHPLIDIEDLWVSQFDMAVGVWAFIGSMVAIPNQCGLYVGECLSKCREEALTLQKEYQDKDEMPALVAEQTTNGVEVYFKFVSKSNQTIEKSQRVPLRTQITSEDAKLLFALQEFMYIWRVFGHCLGVDDKFNIVNEECIARNVTFMLMCFDKIDRPAMETINELTIAGLQLMKGVFLALNCILPEWLASYEAFFKYYYDAFQIPHQFHLKNFKQKFHYFLMVLLFDWLLRVKIFYFIGSKMFFWTLNYLARQAPHYEQIINKKYGHLKFEICDINGNPFQVEFKGHKTELR